MRLVQQRQFLRWAAERSVVLYRDEPSTAKYAATWPRNLTVRDGWDAIVPLPAEPTPSFFAAVLDSLPGWTELALWPKAATWGSMATSDWAPDLCQPSFSGAVMLPRAEAQAATLLLTDLATHGWEPDQDLFLVPDLTGVLVMLDHHDAVCASFADEVDGRSIVAALATRGIVLEDDLPDETFKAPVRRLTSRK